MKMNKKKKSCQAALYDNSFEDDDEFFDRTVVKTSKKVSNVAGAEDEANSDLVGLPTLEAAGARALPVSEKTLLGRRKHTGR